MFSSIPNLCQLYAGKSLPLGVMTTKRVLGLGVEEVKLSPVENHCTRIKVHRGNSRDLHDKELEFYSPFNKEPLKTFVLKIVRLKIVV